jgi:hypothetical protein
MKINLKTILEILCAGLLLGALSVCASGQAEKPQPSLTGKYQGIAKSGKDELTMTLELVEDKGVFSGTVTTPHGTFKIVKGKLVDDLLTLETEGKGTTGEFSLKVKDDKLVGQLSSKGGVGSVELHKVAVDDISGDWDAAADASGQAFPFTLNLKVDGEAVSGTSDSQLGHATISKGVWKDGTLTLVIDSTNGPIGLIATLDGGKLIDDYDFAGRLQGKWVAVRKK